MYNLKETLQARDCKDIDAILEFAKEKSKENSYGYREIDLPSWPHKKYMVSEEPSVVRYDYHQHKVHTVFVGEVTSILEQYGADLDFIACERQLAIHGFTEAFDNDEWEHDGIINELRRLGYERLENDNVFYNVKFP